MIMDNKEILEIAKIIAPYISGGLAGAIFTLIANSKYRKKNRKVLNIEEKLHRYSLNRNSSLNIDNEIKITYNSVEYPNLSLYNAKLTNSGKKRIDRSKIILRFRESDDVIWSKINSSPIDIKKEYEISRSIVDDTQYVDYHLLIENMEVDDIISLSFLFNSRDPEQIKLLPREFDENLIVKEGEISSFNDIEDDFKQILYAYVVFIFSGMIPMFGSIVKAGIFFIMIPSIIRVLNFFLNRNKRDVKRKIEIKDTNVSKILYVSINEKQ